MTNFLYLDFDFNFFFFFVVLEFELRVLSLLGKHSGTWIMPLSPFSLSYFSDSLELFDNHDPSTIILACLVRQGFAKFLYQLASNCDPPNLYLLIFTSWVALIIGLRPLTLTFNYKCKNSLRRNVVWQIIKFFSALIFHL
jgi:hypothetical protein